MSDGYWASRNSDDRLCCLTHRLRKARGLEESLNHQAQRFGRPCARPILAAARDGAGLAR